MYFISHIAAMISMDPGKYAKCTVIFVNNSRNIRHPLHVQCTIQGMIQGAGGGSGKGLWGGDSPPPPSNRLETKRNVTCRHVQVYTHGPLIGGPQCRMSHLRNTNISCFLGVFFAFFSMAICESSNSRCRISRMLVKM